MQTYYETELTLSTSRLKHTVPIRLTVSNSAVTRVEMRVNGGWAWTDAAELWARLSELQRWELKTDAVREYCRLHGQAVAKVPPPIAADACVKDLLGVQP